MLSAASVWLGGLNQDEGWYLYAANLVHEGRMLYRDFFYTQGPEMPRLYSRFVWVWAYGGLLGARLFTLALGLLGIAFAALTARRLAPKGQGNAAALVVAFLLGCNLYHLYYLTIPKAYALASLYVSMGFLLLSRAADEKTSVRAQAVFAALAGLSLALSAGTRISLGALLAVAGIALLLARRWPALAGFCVGGFGGLAFAYGPYLLEAGARAGLVAAQQYHAARGGFDPVWVVGSLSRLVRWYLPLFIVLGLGVAGRLFDGRSKGSRAERLVLDVLLWGFLSVFAVQILAPFPYEDYQVPVMALLAVYAVVTLFSSARLEARPSGHALVLVFGLSYATAFGSPLLERWMTNGQDRFWSLKKEKPELAQLRDAAKRIEALDPGGKTLLTQDLYLAIETNRKVPKGLEMGPFSMLTDDEWRTLLTVTAPTDCRVAALSAYTFAIAPPVCDERPVAQQMDYWDLLKKNYEMVGREEAFGQGATPLLILKLK